MKISQVGINLIKQFEGCSLTAYKCPAGVWTIGFGHTGTVNGVKVGQGMTINQSKAEQLLLDSLDARYEPSVRKLGEMNQNQYDALVCFCYNLGPAIFKGSLLTAITKRDWQDVARQMKLYNKARVNGVLTELKGLTRRRNAEADLLLKPMPVAPTPQGKEEVITKVEIILNGKKKIVEAINKDGFNFIKLRDLQDDKIQVDYDKLPIVKVKG